MYIFDTVCIIMTVLILENEIKQNKLEYINQPFLLLLKSSAAQSFCHRKKKQLNEIIHGEILVYACNLLAATGISSLTYLQWQLFTVLKVIKVTLRRFVYNMLYTKCIYFDWVH